MTGSRLQGWKGRCLRYWRLPVAVFLILAGIGHVVFWYSPRLRPGLPSDGLPSRLLNHPDLPLGVWIPYPHQNLGALSTLGLPSDALEAALRLAELPTPSLPRFGTLAVPPSVEMAVATERRGERFVVAAEVYPSVALFSRLAGRLAGNPWLAGGDLVRNKQRLVVQWHGNVWTVSSQGDVGFGPAQTFPPAMATADRGPDAAPGKPTVLVADVRSARDPLPLGRYYVTVDDHGIELLSDRADQPPTRLAAVMTETKTLLLAVSGKDGPLGAGGQAMALLQQPASEIAELPRGAVLFRPDVDRWDLPAEGLLDLAGRDPSEQLAGTMSLVATDKVGVAGGRALQPAVSALLEDQNNGQLVLGLWVELGSASSEVQRIRLGLERAPLWSQKQLDRWREADRFLAGIAVPWQRLSLVVRDQPARLWLKIEAYPETEPPE